MKKVVSKKEKKNAKKGTESEDKQEKKEEHGGENPQDKQEQKPDIVPKPLAVEEPSWQALGLSHCPCVKYLKLKQQSAVKKHFSISKATGKDVARTDDTILDGCVITNDMIVHLLEGNSTDGQVFFAAVLSYKLSIEATISLGYVDTLNVVKRRSTAAVFRLGAISVYGVAISVYGVAKS